MTRKFPWLPWRPRSLPLQSHLFLRWLSPSGCPGSSDCGLLASNLLIIQSSGPLHMLLPLSAFFPPFLDHSTCSKSLLFFFLNNFFVSYIVLITTYIILFFTNLCLFHPLSLVLGDKYLLNKYPPCLGIDICCMNEFIEC